MVQGGQAQGMHMSQRAQGASKARLKAPQRDALATLQIARGHQKDSNATEIEKQQSKAKSGSLQLEDHASPQQRPAGQPVPKRRKLMAKARISAAAKPPIEHGLEDF